MEGPKIDPNMIPVNGLPKRGPHAIIGNPHMVPR